MTMMSTEAPLRHLQGAGENVRQQFGVLPWRVSRQGGLRILLITDRDSAEWGVPKGWPAAGRVPFMSAALDAFEEAGIIGDIDSRPLTDYTRVEQRGGDGDVLTCRVTLFAMRVRGTLLQWKESGERQRRWFAADEAADRIGNVELAHFVSELASYPQTFLDETGRLTLAGGV